jgi:SulP family sulfate permease
MKQAARDAAVPPAKGPRAAPVSAQKRGSLVNAIVAGSISGAMNIPCCIALASIVFLGDLRPYFPLGIGLCLVGNAMVSAVASLRSSCRYGVATIQDSTPAIVALMAVSIASKTHTTASMLPTVVVAIALSTLTMGLMLYGLGWFRLGIGTRFFPPSVVSGFLAGTGVILVLGGLGFLINANLGVNNLDQLWSTGAPKRWLPGLLFGVILFGINLRYQQSWVLPTILFGSALIFTLSLPVLQISNQEAIARGWIEGGFPSGRLWPPFGPAALSQLDWRILGEHWIHYLVIAFVGSLALLLNLSGLEQATGESIDIDQELKANGLANLAGGILGGANGYLTVSDSVLSYQMKAPGRLPSLINTGMSVAALGLGTALFKLFPNFLMGGLTIFLGLSILKEPLIDSWQRVSRLEYTTIAAITITITFSGFIHGVLIGLLASVLFFVISCSRINLVKFASSSLSIRSKELRPESDFLRLRQQGESVQILGLQGFMFFGSAFSLYRRIEAKLNRKDCPKPRFFVLDFTAVVGIDSGGMTWLDRIASLAREHQTVLVLSHLSPASKQQFLRFSGVNQAIGPEAVGCIHWANNMDEALQWCEDQLLALNEEPADASTGTPSTLERLDPEAMAWAREFIAKAHPYLRREQYQPGAILWHSGDPGGWLYVIESGRIEVSSETANGEQKRMMAMGPGGIAGMVSFFLQSPRGIKATISRDAVLYSLSTEQMDAMASQQPELALSLYKRLATVEANMINENLHSADFAMR